MRKRCSRPSTSDFETDISAEWVLLKHQETAQFKEVYKDSSILGTMTAADMQDNFRVKLKNPEEYQGVVSAVQGLPGVQKVQDLRNILQPLFDWLNPLLAAIWLANRQQKPDGAWLVQPIYLQATLAMVWAHPEAPYDDAGGPGAYAPSAGALAARR